MTRETSTLRVLMVTPRYFPYMGGLETHVHEAGRRLVKSGVDVTLLTTAPHAHPTPLPKEEVKEGMHVIRVRAWPPERDYYLAPEIYSIIKRGGWDLVHCQGCHTFVPPLAMLAAKKAKLPYIVTFHSGGHSSRLRTKIRGTQWKLLRPLLANASKLIGVSRFEADYFRDMLGLPADLFSVIPPPSTLPSLMHLPPRASAQSLIVSVGRLERYKGHQRLIAALPKIREQRPDAHLLIVGVGPYEVPLRELAQKIGVTKQVEIRAVPGNERQAMVELLSQATLVALLSEYEAHPAAVEEALALRRPVLVADTSGMHELAEQGFARAVSLNSTPEELAKAVLHQIEEPLLPAQLALPTWEDCTQKLLTIYSEIVGRARCVS
jgi:glycosyltransferase involved in cell wall biosynthesis